MKAEQEKYRLLVVEDNPGDYMLLEEYLRMSKLPVEKTWHALNIKSAMEMAVQNPVDLILLDLTLPDSTGTDSVMLLDHLLPTTPIVVFSGLSTLETAIESISLGAQDYLIKGEFDERLLSKSVQYSIERKKSQEKLRKSNELYEFVNKATQDTIWEWNFKTKQGMWGEGFISTFGYSKEELSFDKNWTETFIHPDDQLQIQQCFSDHVADGDTNCDVDFRFRCADNSYRDVHCRTYIIYDAPRSPQRMIGSLSDITERKKLEKQLAEQQINQQKLITETTILAQEKERNELGRELHDNINQILATVKMYLGMARDGRQVGEDLLGKSYDYVEEAMHEIRTLSHSLVAPSLGDIGLKEALEALAENTSGMNGLEITVLVDDQASIRNTDKNKDLMLYRIAQEQLNNIIKHAKAKNVTIALYKKEDNTVMYVEDNGAGFDTSKKVKGIGLQNIRNRVEFYNGKLIIRSAPGQGCTLEVYIPNS